MEYLQTKNQHLLHESSASYSLPPSSSWATDARTVDGSTRASLDRLRYEHAQMQSYAPPPASAPPLPPSSLPSPSALPSHLPELSEAAPVMPPPPEQYLQSHTQAMPHQGHLPMPPWGGHGQGQRQPDGRVQAQMNIDPAPNGTTGAAGAALAAATAEVASLREQLQVALNDAEDWKARYIALQRTVQSHEDQLRHLHAERAQYQSIGMQHAAEAARAHERAETAAAAASLAYESGTSTSTHTVPLAAQYVGANPYASAESAQLQYSHAAVGATQAQTQALAQQAQTQAQWQGAREYEPESDSLRLRRTDAAGIGGVPYPGEVRGSIAREGDNGSGARRRRSVHERLADPAGTQASRRRNSANANGQGRRPSLETGLTPETVSGFTAGRDAENANNTAYFAAGLRGESPSTDAATRSLHPRWKN